MKRRNKGFTIVEVLAVIIILGVITAIAVPSYSRYRDKARADNIRENEKSLREATRQFFIQNSDRIPSSIGDKDTITMKELVDEQFIKPIPDPDEKDAKCSNSYVDVERTTYTSEDGSPAYNVSLDYKVCLICKSYKSEGCS